MTRPTMSAHRINIFCQHQDCGGGRKWAPMNVYLDPQETMNTTIYTYKHSIVQDRIIG